MTMVEPIAARPTSHHGAAECPVRFAEFLAGRTARESRGTRPNRLQAMKESLERLRRLGVEAIED